MIEFLVALTFMGQPIFLKEDQVLFTTWKSCETTARILNNLHGSGWGCETLPPPGGPDA